MSISSSDYESIVANNVWSTALEFKNHKINDKGVEELADALEVNITITSLDLFNNGISDKGVIALAEVLKINESVTKINLMQNKIGDEGAIALAEALKLNRSVTVLTLYGNKIGNKGAKALREALNVNKTLAWLNLSSNEIGDEGAIALAEALKLNKSMTVFSLEENKIGDKGAIALGEALKLNKTIAWFILGGSEVSDKAAKILAEALKVNKSVTRLVLSSKIGEEGAMALIEALGVNKTITDIHVDNNHVKNEASIHKIKRLCKKNHGLFKAGILYMQQGNEKGLLKLLGRGVSVHSFLPEAITTKNVSMVQFFLQQGAVKNFPYQEEQKEPELSIELAKKFKNQEIISLLEDALVQGQDQIPEELTKQEVDTLQSRSDELEKAMRYLNGKLDSLQEEVEKLQQNFNKV